MSTKKTNRQRDGTYRVATRCPTLCFFVIEDNINTTTNNGYDSCVVARSETVDHFSVLLLVFVCTRFLLAVVI